MRNDEYFMKLAYKEAQKCVEIDEVPVGAIIVQNQKVIARGHNLREHHNDPTAHAEIVALKKACRKLKSWRLENCEIYVTLEPCAMCAGAILWARISRVVYGASDPKGGALGTSFDLYQQKGLNHYPLVEKGVLATECSNILKEYFQKKRKKV